MSSMRAPRSTAPDDSTGWMQFERFESVAERAEAREFLRSHLGDHARWPVPPQKVDQVLGVPSIIRVARDANGDLAAVGFASNNPEDVRRGKHLRWPVDRVRVIATEMLVLHGIAVAPQARRRGLGRALVSRLLLDGANAGATVATTAFNDTTPRLAEFYRWTGFQLLARGEQLNLGFTRLAGDVLAFPQGDPRYRWGVRIIRPDRVSLFQQLNTVR